MKNYFYHIPVIAALSVFFMGIGCGNAPDIDITLDFTGVPAFSCSPFGMAGNYAIVCKLTKDATSVEDGKFSCNVPANLPKDMAFGCAALVESPCQLIDPTFQMSDMQKYVSSKFLWTNNGHADVWMRFERINTQNNNELMCSVQARLEIRVP